MLIRKIMLWGAIALGFLTAGFFLVISFLSGRLTTEVVVTMIALTAIVVIPYLFVLSLRKRLMTGNTKKTWVLVSMIGSVLGLFYFCGMLIHLAMQGAFSWMLAIGIIAGAIIIEIIGLILSFRKLSRSQD